MMDWIPNRLVYDPKISCSPSTWGASPEFGIA